MWKQRYSVDIDGTQYFVSESGEKGHPLLLLHGLDWTGELWRSLCPYLNDNFRLIAPDLAGHGRSSAPHKLDLATLADHLSTLITRLDAPTPTVVASSWAGFLAVELAARYPDVLHDLILLDGGYHPMTSVPGLTWEDFSTAMTPSDALTSLEAFLEYMRSDAPGFWNPDIEAAVSDQVQADADSGSVLPRLNGETRLACLKAVWAYDPHKAAPSIKVPAAVVLPYSTNEPPEYRKFKRRQAVQFVQSLANGQLLEMDDTDHLIMLHRPQELASMIRELLAERSS